jgi:NifU-like protein involved in Fe-S cluster formation
MDEDRIMDHWSNPINKGLTFMPTHSGAALNPGCGDTLRLDFRAVSGIMEGIGFDGKGCVMSMAGGSLLVEWLLKTEQRSEEWILDAPKAWTPEEMRTLVKTLYGGLPIPVRIGCVMLPILALRNVQSLREPREQ